MGLEQTKQYDVNQYELYNHKDKIHIYGHWKDVLSDQYSGLIGTIEKLFAAVDLNFGISGLDGIAYKAGQAYTLALENYASIDSLNDRVDTLENTTGWQHIVIKDVKSSNTDGGTFTSGAWRTRDLNTVDKDDSGVVVLSSNQLTLPAGRRYIAHGSCPAYRVSQHQARLYDYSNSTVLITGTSEYLRGDSSTSTNRSFLAGEFTLTASTTIEVQHRCTSTKDTNGMGTATTFGECVYTLLDLWRLP